MHSNTLMTLLLATLAIIFAIIGNSKYFIDTLKGKTKPHPYTWLIWSIVSGVTFFGQYFKGAGIAALPTLVAEIFTIIIFLFSLKYGFKEINKKDHYFLTAALLALLSWFITKDPTIAVIIVVIIDIIAFLPTIRKSLNANAHNETAMLYAMNVLRHLITLYLLESFNIATALHSIAMIICNSLMVIFIVKKQNAKF